MKNYRRSQDEVRLRRRLCSSSSCEKAGTHSGNTHGLQVGDCSDRAETSSPGSHTGHDDNGRGTVHKVHAHPERRKRRWEWTREEEGNAKADAVAADRAREVNVTVQPISLTGAIYGSMTWKNREGQICFDARISARDRRYKAERDRQRAQAVVPRGPRWKDTTNRIEQKCSRAMSVRIMWDKYMMENQTKRKCKEIQRCPECGAIPSQRHHRMSTTRTGCH